MPKVANAAAFLSKKQAAIEVASFLFVCIRRMKLPTLSRLLADNQCFVGKNQEFSLPSIIFLQYYSMLFHTN